MGRPAVVPPAGRGGDRMPAPARALGEDRGRGGRQRPSLPLSEVRRGEVDEVRPDPLPGCYVWRLKPDEIAQGNALENKARKGEALKG